MQLILIRHGIAVDPEKFAAKGGVETERPLTERGVKRSKRAARGLRRIIEHIDLVATSPYLRAVRTGELLADAFDRRGRPACMTVPVLSPGAMPAKVAEWLQQQEQDATIALVGHEPDMSRLTAYLTVDGDADFVRFGKAGAALLNCSDGPVAGSCELVWVLPSSILRRIGV